MNKQIVIIGGNGLMGKLFNSLWSQQGITVTPLGRNDWQNAAAILKSCAAVIVCVPINSTEKIIRQVAPLISSATILADFTSIKSTPLIAMLAAHTGPVVGLHPMFGPTITSPHNQVIVKCDGRYPEKYQWLIDSLQQLDFTIKPMSAEKHDQAMNFIQGIEHFLTFSLGTFLHHKNEHPQELLEIASPIYLAKLMLMGRIFDQDPALYADIIMADKTRLQLIREFSLWLTSWVDKLEQYNKQDFIAEFSRASQWMGEFTAYAQKISDDFLTIDLE